MCAPPCEVLHLRCDDCGTALDGCPFDSPAHHGDLARRILPLVGDESETLLVVVLVERAVRSGSVVSWDEVRSLARARLTDAGRRRREPLPVLA